MNGIFKDNFALDTDFDGLGQAKKAIEYYNNRLPHSSVDMLTPNQAHDRIGALKKILEVVLERKTGASKLEK